MAVMVKTIKEEDFDEVIVFESTITVKDRRVIIDENGLISYAGKISALGAVLFGFEFSGDSLAALPSIVDRITPAMLIDGSPFGPSDKGIMVSVNCVAKLSSIDGEEVATEVRLNFVKLFYTKKFSCNSFADDEFFVYGVKFSMIQEYTVSLLSDFRV